jgi:hypothetical protein
MSIMERIHKMAANREKAAKLKATKQLRNAKSSAARERVLLTLKREQLQIQKEVADARTEALHAEAALKEAKRKAGYLTIDERLSKASASVGRGIATGVKAYRSVSGTAGRGKSSGKGKRKSETSLSKFIWG